MKVPFFCLVFTLSAFSVTYKPSKFHAQESYEELCDRLGQKTQYNLLDPVINNPLMVMLLLLINQKTTLEDFLELLCYSKTNLNQQLSLRTNWLLIDNLANLIIYHGDTVWHVLRRYGVWLPQETRDWLEVELIAKDANPSIRNIRQLTPDEERTLSLLYHCLDSEEYYNRLDDNALKGEIDNIQRILRRVNQRLNVFTIEETQALKRDRDIINRILFNRFQVRQLTLDAQRNAVAATNQTAVRLNAPRVNAPAVEQIFYPVIEQNGCRLP